MAKTKTKKRSPVKRTIMLVVRLTEAEKRELRIRAAMTSLTLSSWARMTLLSHSKEV